MNGAAAKILVVDDEAIARANLARVLAHDGHETAQAGAGALRWRCWSMGNTIWSSRI